MVLRTARSHFIWTAALAVICLAGCGEGAGGTAAPVSAVPLSPPPPPPPPNVAGDEAVPAAEAVAEPSNPVPQGEAPAASSDDAVQNSPVAPEPAAENPADQDNRVAAVQNNNNPPANQPPGPPPAKGENPFPRRFPVPEFSKQITW